MKTIIIGWALSIFTLTADPLTVEIETVERAVPYLSQDTCIRDEDLSLLTGKREITSVNSKVVELCTPVLLETRDE